MTLDEAILRLDNMIRGDDGDFSREDIAAFKLAIEALKHIKHHRETGVLSPGFELPGETRE